MRHGGEHVRFRSEFSFLPAFAMSAFSVHREGSELTVEFCLFTNVWRTNVVLLV